jgi:hypothetical protein
MGVVGVVAGSLGIWRRRLSRIFAVCLAGFLVFELFCFMVGVELPVPWWLLRFLTLFGRIGPLSPIGRISALAHPKRPVM